MKRQQWIWSAAALGGLCSLLLGSPAAAQMEREVREEPVDEPFFREDRPARIREAIFITEERDPHRPRTATDIGMALQVGGGVSTFTGGTTADFSDMGGAWNARLILGTRSIIGAELGYVGSAHGIEAVGLDPAASLLGNGAEAVVRLNILSGMWQPYLLAGAGWMNYRIVNADFNTAAINDVDNVIMFPLGGGLAFRYRGLVIDARTTFRPVIEDQMLEGVGGSLNSWQAQLSGGWEF